jgi:hypothetical protein
MIHGTHPPTYETPMNEIVDHTPWSAIIAPTGRTGENQDHGDDEDCYG